MNLKEKNRGSMFEIIRQRNITEEACIKERIILK
jgi:hypothetical protein